MTSPTPSHSIIPIERYKKNDKILQIDVFIFFTISRKKIRTKNCKTEASGVKQFEFDINGERKRDLKSVVLINSEI